MSSLGIVIDSEKISQIMSVANAALGDFKPLLFIMLGGWLAFFVISFIIGLVRKKSGIPPDNDDDDDEPNWYDLNDDEFFERDDDF